MVSWRRTVLYSPDPEAVDLPESFDFELAVDGGEPIAELTGAIDALCRRVEDHREETVIVIRMHSALPEVWPGAVGPREINRWERAIRRLERQAAITVGAAGGRCGGPALDLLLATDYRVAKSDLRLMMPVGDGQFWPGMAVYRLVHQIGEARARQLVLWGHEVDAEQAFDIGLVDELHQDLDDAARRAVALVGRQGGREVAIRRQLLMEAATTPFEEAFGSHLAACDRELRRLRGEPPS